MITWAFLQNRRPGLPSDYNFFGGRCNAAPCTGMVGTLYNTGLYCPWSGTCREITRYTRGCVGVINPSATQFRLCAATNLDADADYEVWLIDQDKSLTQFMVD